MKRLLIILLALALAFLMVLPAWGNSLTTVSLEPSRLSVAPGQTFEVDVFFDLGSESRGAQFDLTFDHNILTCNSVTEGDLFSLGGTQPTQWRAPVIDNRVNGAIIGAACVVVNPAIPVSGSGVFATISFTALETLGTTDLELSNVIVGDGGGNSVEVVVVDGSVDVGIQGDVNSDGRVNILDMVLVGLHWGETGSLPEDLNKDGIVNILDGIIIGIHWTG